MKSIPGLRRLRLLRRLHRNCSKSCELIYILHGLVTLGALRCNVFFFLGQLRANRLLLRPCLDELRPEMVSKPVVSRKTSLKKLKQKRQAISLFLTMFYLMRRRVALDTLVSKPSRPSFTTPRFFDVKFCAQARCFRALALKTLAPTVQNEPAKNEGVSLSSYAQA